MSSRLDVRRPTGPSRAPLRAGHLGAGLGALVLLGVAVQVGPLSLSSAQACVRAATVTCVAQTIEVTGVYDGAGSTVPGIGGGPGEGSGMVFEVTNGGTVRNVTISSTTAGIACLGSCTLENVHWLHAGDYAAAALGGPGTTMTVNGGTVDSADDKAFQHNGNGTVVLNGIRLGSVGHVYASCGSCGGTPHRSVVASGVSVGRAAYDAFAVQIGDATPRLSNITVGSGRVCTWYGGNSSSGRAC